MSLLIDSHCHLDFPDFEAEREAVLARAKAAGVARMITISTRVRRFPAVLGLAQAHEELFCSVGTHPHNAAEELDVSAEELARLARHPKVIAIGEAGLDYCYDKSPRAAQAQGLRTHIQASRQTQLPMVIHARNADDDMIAILEEESAAGSFPFVLHCFSSGSALAQAGIRLGGYLSFSGILTFKNSGALRDIAAAAPHDRLLVETDAPYLAPVPHRGRRNEPAFVADTAAVLADVIGLDREALAALATENTLRLFSKMPPLAAGKA